MFELRISGATLDELKKNLEDFVGFNLDISEDATLGRQVAGDTGDTPNAEQPKRARGRPRKDVPVNGDSVEDINPEQTPAQVTHAYTIDDVKQRTQAVITSHKDRGNDMPAVVTYVKKLFAGFGVEKAGDIKPEDFARYMSVSQGYLDGTAS